MFIRSGDAVRDFERWDREQQRKLKGLPKCSYCGQLIQDEDCYEINGDLVHDDCVVDYINENCLVSTDKYIN